MLIAHVAGRSNATTLPGCQLYVIGRAIYVPLYAAGVPHLRMLVWGVSLVGLVMVIGALLF